MPAVIACQRLARGFSFTADGWLYPLLPLLVALYKPSIAWPFFVTLLVGYSLERLLYLAIKKHFKRCRPPNAIPGFYSVIQASDEFSFPSGHTSASFFAVTTLLLFFPGGAMAFAYLWCVSVALSRIVLGVHFPLDTVAGATLGVSTALLVFNQLSFY